MYNCNLHRQLKAHKGQPIGSNEWADPPSFSLQALFCLPIHDIDEVMEPNFNLRDVARRLEKCFVGEGTVHRAARCYPS